MHGSLMYRDTRLTGFDAAAVVEVIEHLDPPRLAAFERVLFEFARPGTVVLTTPNAEYNVKWETLPAGQFRHRDHRFEWTRDEFQRAGRRRSRRVSAMRCGFAPIGDADAEVGPPTQMGVFTRAGPLMTLTIPELSLVVLIGPSGSGKSTFARTHFKPTEILSSDFCRGLVSDDENDQAATDDAFAVLHFIAAKRLARGPADGRRRDQRPAGGAEAAGRAGARSTTSCRSPSCSTSRSASARTGIRVAPTAHFGPHVIRQQVSQLRRVARGIWDARDSATSTSCRRRRRSRPRPSSASRSGTTGSPTTARSTSSATSTAAATNWTNCSPTWATRRDVRRHLARTRRHGRRSSSATSSTVGPGSWTRSSIVMAHGRGRSQRCAFRAITT